MENASKALLIAAAVLVAILIIAFGIKIFSSNSNTTKVAQDTGKSLNTKTEETTSVAIRAIKGKTSLDKINFCGKTVQTVSPGDDIKIGNEKFQVKAKTNDKITALAYYNIELKTDKPKQSANAKNIIFSTEAYWPDSTKEDDDLDMSKSNIQKYIDAYQNTIGLQGITTRVPRKKDVYNTPGSRNPSGIGYFWLGTRGQEYQKNIVKYVGNGDWMAQTGCTYSGCGVRPIIEISI